jgi:hypothetical protein
MRKDALEAQPERRHLRRRRVLLSGVVSDADGQSAIDCTIRDMSVRGAQVQLPRALQLDKEIYLVDTRNEIAYLAKVSWIEADRAGLSFVRSYELASDLPTQLRFLEKLLFDAKLRQVRALMRRGLPVEEAIRTVGLSEKYLERFDELGGIDKGASRLLHHAMRLLGKSG